MKYIKIVVLLGILGILLMVIANLVIVRISNKYIYENVNEVPECYSAIVLGALVSQSGDLSDFLEDRMNVAIELYENKKIERFLLSGDHGQTNYDEVNSMKKYLTDRGINTSDIFMDHAGFDTYNSMVRAKEIFQINKVIIVSQKFHLARAVFIARSKGIEAYGIVADRRQYASIKYLRKREVIANVKAFVEVITNRKPHFLGEQIPITGNSELSYD